jgi:hypothetical protein
VQHRELEQPEEQLPPVTKVKDQAEATGTFLVAHLGLEAAAEVQVVLVFHL